MTQASPVRVSKDRGTSVSAPLPRPEGAVHLPNLPQKNRKEKIREGVLTCAAPLLHPMVKLLGAFWLWRISVAQQLSRRAPQHVLVEDPLPDAQNSHKAEPWQSLPSAKPRADEPRRPGGSRQSMAAKHGCKAWLSAPASRQHHLGLCILSHWCPKKEGSNLRIGLGVFHPFLKGLKTEDMPPPTASKPLARTGRSRLPCTCAWRPATSAAAAQAQTPLTQQSGLDLPTSVLLLAPASSGRGGGRGVKHLNPRPILKTSITW